MQIVIPKEFPVRPLAPNAKAEDKATCGTCGLSWDDAIVTAYTPAPSARCPFEDFHLYPEPKLCARDGQRLPICNDCGNRMTEADVARGCCACGFGIRP